MNDEQNSGTDVPPSTPAGGGAFDWLIESHQQSAPMAPLTEDGVASAPRPLSFDPPDPAAQPPVEPVPPPVSAVTTAYRPAQYEQAPYDPVPYEPVPVARQAPVYEEQPFVPSPVFASAPVLQEPAGALQSPAVLAPPVTQAPPAALPPVRSEAEAPSSALPPGGPPHAATPFGGGFALERRSERSRSGNGPLDWGAFVLAFLAPPIGLILGVVAALTGSRSRGYATSLAKAAIGIGAVLTLVLGVAVVVVSKISSDSAAHAAIVASSADWCTKLKADPATLSSDTFGWPAPANTIPESIKSIQAYEAKWDALAKVAPAGIRADTEKVATTAKSIVASVQSTQTLNDESNVAQLQNVVELSGIKGWVSTYCG